MITHYNQVVLGLVEQINEARIEAGWSVAELLAKSKLGLERSTLHRKLHGDTPMTDEEIEACAKALGRKIVFDGERRSGRAL